MDEPVICRREPMAVESASGVGGATVVSVTACSWAPGPLPSCADQAWLAPPTLPMRAAFSSSVDAVVSAPVPEARISPPALSCRSPKPLTDLVPAPRVIWLALTTSAPAAALAAPADGVVPPLLTNVNLPASIWPAATLPSAADCPVSDAASITRLASCPLPICVLPTRSMPP